MSNNCSNCYNGCTEITSDKCVKYTGVDVPVLGIKNGDSLSFVEQALITYLSSTLDGTGIFPIIPPSVICPTVQANLDDCNPLSLNNYLEAIIESLCEIEQTIGVIQEEVPTDPYILRCLSVPGITDDPNATSTDTQAVIQAVIDKVCEVEQSLNNFITFVENTYVAISDINTYIENYINNDPSQTLISNRMVPFSATPYFGSLNNFDGGGAGIGDWDRIFLCNGANGTPDLRGRVVVASTTGMPGGGGLDPAVVPILGQVPEWSLGTTGGEYRVTLDAAQIPAHTHASTVTSTLSPATHSHKMVSLGTANTQDPVQTDQQIRQAFSTGGNLGYAMRGTSSPATNGLTSEVTQTLNVGVSNASTGGGQSHANWQPGYGAYYIIYIP
jgi:microcystin-dependent protein